MWTIFKACIEFVTILLLFYVLVFWPGGMSVLSSLTRDRTHIPCIGRQSLNHWTTREVSALLFFFSFKYLFISAAPGLSYSMRDLCCGMLSCGTHDLF